jgi:hypothetical protein
MLGSPTPLAALAAPPPPVVLPGMAGPNLLLGPEEGSLEAMRVRLGLWAVSIEVQRLHGALLLPL